MESFPCPCCGYLTFGEPPVEAQANYRSFGACERCSVESCRAPGPDDVRDPSWRPVDLATDRFPGEAPDHYYWRRSG